jgi:hypothetical protein
MRNAMSTAQTRQHLRNAGGATPTESATTNSANRNNFKYFPYWETAANVKKARRGLWQMVASFLKAKLALRTAE